jgi:hypothetical protein
MASPAAAIMAIIYSLARNPATHRCRRGGVQRVYEQPAGVSLILINTAPRHPGLPVETDVTQPTEVTRDPALWLLNGCS